MKRSQRPVPTVSRRHRVHRPTGRRARTFPHDVADRAKTDPVEICALDQWRSDEVAVEPVHPTVIRAHQRAGIAWTIIGDRRSPMRAHVRQHVHVTRRIAHRHERLPRQRKREAVTCVGDLLHSAQRKPGTPEHTVDFEVVHARVASSAATMDRALWGMDLNRPSDGGRSTSSARLSR